MLVAPAPFMILSMIFSSKVLSASGSSSASWARATPDASNRPMPRATAESRAARTIILGDFSGDFVIIEPLTSVLRMAFPVLARPVVTVAWTVQKISPLIAKKEGHFSPLGTDRSDDRIDRDQGAFGAGTPMKESYSKAAT